MASFSRIFKQLEQTIENAINDQDSRKKTARAGAKLVRDRTRDGLGVRNKKLTNFPRLDKNTVEKKRYLSRRGDLSKFTSPTDSNRTQSGKMVRSIRGKATPEGFEIAFTGQDNIRKGQLNTDPAIMDLSTGEEQKLADRFARFIARIINKF